MRYLLFFIGLFPLSLFSQGFDSEKNVIDILTKYESSLSKLKSSSLAKEEKVQAKKVLRKLILSPSIKVINDLNVEANDSVLSIKKYLDILEDSLPSDAKVRLQMSQLQVVPLHVDIPRNSYRLKASVKKMVSYEIIVSDSTLFGNAYMVRDTIEKKHLTFLTFYFKTTFEHGKFSPIKIEAIQLKGKKPVYYKNMSDLQKWYVALSPSWRKKMKSELKLPQVPSDYNLNRVLGLKKISLEGISADDLKPLSGMKGLEELTLSNMNLDTLLALKGLNKLKWLNLEGNELKTLSGLEELSRLEYLNISQNSISDLSPLEACVNLMSLHMSGNHVEDLSALRFHPHLLTLVAQNNYLEDLSPLSYCPGLKVLNLARNKDVKDLSPLVNCLAMGKLNVFNTGVETLKPIAMMSSIYELNVGYIKETSLDAIRTLRNLTSLNISGNTLSDFSALNNFQGLRKFDCSKTKISDISPLLRMSNIRELKAMHTDFTKADIQRFKKKYPDCEITYY